MTTGDPIESAIDVPTGNPIIAPRDLSDPDPKALTTVRRTKAITSSINAIAVKRVPTLVALTFSPFWVWDCRTKKVVPSDVEDKAQPEVKALMIGKSKAFHKIAKLNAIGNKTPHDAAINESGKARTNIFALKSNPPIYFLFNIYLYML